MKIKCPKCAKIYNIPDEKIPNRDARTKCKVCGQVITIKGKEETRNSNVSITVTCPKCGATNTSKNECSKCGIIYEKYIALQNKKKEELQKPIVGEIENENSISHGETKKKVKFLHQINTVFISSLSKIKNTSLSITKIIPICVLALIISIYAFNYLSLQKKMNEVISQDYRNKGISVAVHYKNYFNLHKLVYNLDGLEGSNSKIDVFRVFLQFAEKMSSKRFNYVILSTKGDIKFYLNGDYFNKLGVEYSTQNPAYTMRTFPENLYKPTGEKAFPTWSGGILGVFPKQMEDFNSFHDQWYWADLPK